MKEKINLLSNALPSIKANPGFKALDPFSGMLSLIPT